MVALFRLFEWPRSASGRLDGASAFRADRALVTDYDRAHRTLSITKARVAGADKDVTKTGNDRRIVLSPRAVAVLERQFALRERHDRPQSTVGRPAARP